MRRLVNPLNCTRKYRFVTPSRSGKWYADLTEAQRALPAMDGVVEWVAAMG